MFKIIYIYLYIITNLHKFYVYTIPMKASSSSLNIAAFVRWEEPLHVCEQPGMPHITVNTYIVHKSMHFLPSEWW